MLLFPHPSLMEEVKAAMKTDRLKKKKGRWQAESAANCKQASSKNELWLKYFQKKREISTDTLGKVKFSENETQSTDRFFSEVIS